MLFHYQFEIKKPNIITTTNTTTQHYIYKKKTMRPNRKNLNTKMNLPSLRKKNCLVQVKERKSWKERERRVEEKQYLWPPDKSYRWGTDEMRGGGWVKDEWHARTPHTTPHHTTPHTTPHNTPHNTPHHLDEMILGVWREGGFGEGRWRVGGRWGEGGWREACWRLVGDWMEALGMGETPYWNNNTLSSHTFLRKLRSTINNARMYV